MLFTMDARGRERVTRGTASPLEGERSLLLALERVNRTIFAAPDLESMLADVLDVMLDLLNCDRAWLVSPCDPREEWLTVPIERSRAEWPGAGATAERLPMLPGLAKTLERALSEPRAWRFDGVHDDTPVEPELLAQFSIQSMMLIALRPRSGPVWALGVHNCSRARVYCNSDATLIESIAARLADGLTGFLSFQASAVARKRLEEAQSLACTGSFEWTAANGAYWSGELYRLLGLQRGQRPELFASVLECIHPDDVAAMRATVGEVMQRGGSYDLQARAVRPNGEQWTMHARGRAVLGEDGRLESIMGVAQDVTERVTAEEHRRSLEAELRQSQRMQSLGQLTGGVAHDFNNLLTVILGNLEEVPHALRQGEDVGELIEQVNGAARRAAELTQMLMAFSRNQPLKPQVVDVNHLLTEFQSLLRRTLGESIAIVLRLGTDCRCLVDPAQLHNSLLNLTLNARDAMPNGGALSISSALVAIAEASGEMAPGQYVKVSVQDTGSGMSEAVLARSIEPFFTTKEPGKGTGLGLSMVYGFAKQSGGQVRLESAVGVGTSAHLYLPATLKQVVAPEARRSAKNETPGSGQLILIVEDEPSVRALTTRMVRQAGYRVLVAEDGPTALTLLQDNPTVALLFTDIVLPGGMNGVVLADAAKQRAPELRVLFTSGYSDNALLDGGRLDPNVILLQKPFRRDALLDHIRQALPDER
jgi:PAS domain S-box-containing protein